MGTDRVERICTLASLQYAVLEAAEVYVESKHYSDVDWRSEQQYQKLVEAVKKWQAGGREEVADLA